MDASERKKIAEWKAANFTCGVCGERTNKFVSIGSRGCGQHREPLDAETNAYPCCGMVHRSDPHPFRRGCVSADHNELPVGARNLPQAFTRWHDLEMSHDAARAMPQLRGKEFVIPVGRAGFFERVSVRRFEDPALALYR